MKEVVFHIPERLSFGKLREVCLSLGLDVDRVLENPQETLEVYEADAEKAEEILWQLEPRQAAEIVEKTDDFHLCNVVGVLIAVYYRQLMYEFYLYNLRAEQLLKKYVPDESKSRVPYERCFVGAGFQEYQELCESPLSDLFIYMLCLHLEVYWNKLARS